MIRFFYSKPNWMWTRNWQDFYYFYDVGYATLYSRPEPDNEMTTIIICAGGQWGRRFCEVNHVVGNDWRPLYWLSTDTVQELRDWLADNGFHRDPTSGTDNTTINF